MVTLREEGVATATGAGSSGTDCAAARCGKGKRAAAARSSPVNRTRAPVFGVLLSGLSRAHGISVLSLSMRQHLAKNGDRIADRHVFDRVLGGGHRSRQLARPLIPG